MSFGHLQETVAAIFALSLDVVKSFTQVLYAKLNKSKMVKITDLPVEIIANILTFLPPNELAAMSQVCRTFHEASNIDYVWLRRCRLEYDIDTSPSQLSSKTIYTKLLYSYGYLLGYWQPEISSYGGLVRVEYEDGKLIGSELSCFAGSNVRLPLRKRRHFSIEINNESKSEVKCIVCAQKVHQGAVTRLGKNKFSFDCLDKGAHDFLPQGMSEMEVEEAVQILLDEEHNGINNDDFQRQSEELQLTKQLVRLRYKNCFNYNRVFMPKKRTNVPIQPGIFQGTYGAHGMEIIMLDYDGTIARAVKVSGDPNVPANKITFMAELNRSMFLSLDEQSSVNHLDSIVPVPMRYNSSDDRHQPFKVPKECCERSSHVPKSCVGRFSGSGQIAGQGFTNPSFTNGHWVIFDEDLFGFLWLDLLSLSMFARIRKKTIAY